MSDAKDVSAEFSTRWLSLLVLLSFGVPYNAVRILFLVLAIARHKIKTG
jgi:hypothetical protein